MTAGAEFVCCEDKCGGSGGGNGNVGGNGGRFVGDGSVDMSVGDTGAVDGNGDGEVDQFKKEGLGVEKEGVSVELLVSDTNGIGHGDMTVSDAEVKAVNLENGLTVDPLVVSVSNGIAQNVNGCFDEISGEQEADVKSAEEVDNAKMDDTGFGLNESTVNSVESFQMTVYELGSAVKPSDVTVTPSLSTLDVINGTDESLSAPFAISNTDNGVMVNDGLESVINLIDKAKCGVTVDGSGKASEDLEFQVTADVSESFGSPVGERKGQATVDVSGKTYEDLGSQVIADEQESCGSPIKEQECKVSVDGSDSIGSLVDNQECPLSVDESELSAKRTEKVESNTVAVELDRKSEEHQELSVIPSEVNVDSGLVLPDEVDAMANGQGEKFDRVLEMGETQISGTEADGSLKNLLKVTESVEVEVNTEEIKEQVKVEDEIQESQGVVIDNVQDQLYREDKTVESANEADLSLEAETNIETVIHENTSLQYGVGNCIDKPQEGLQPEASAVETTNILESECNSCELLVEKDDGSLSNPDDLTVAEQKVETESHLGTENRSAEGITVIGNVDVSDDDDEKETGVKDAEDVSPLVTEIRSPEGMDCGTKVESVVVSDDEEKESEVKDAHVELVHHIVSENRSAGDMDYETGIKNVDFPDEEKESEVNDAPVGNQSTLSFSDTIVNHGAVIEFGSIGRLETTPSIQNEEVEDMKGIQSDEIPNFSVEGGVNDVQIEEVEVLEYNFLVRIPRFEDENFRDQVRSAQELVEQKTRLRGLIRAKVIQKRDLMKAYSDEYDLVKKDEIAARRVVKAKRQEIESVQAIISRWKNAMSVEDIDNRIFGVEYMIQHETIHLTDEKEFIREIKQLKSLRDQLASNMGTPEEIRHAIDTKDQNEERLKTLRKELESLKREVSKVEDVLEQIAIKYEAIMYEERELQRQFRAADVVRQKAYADLNNLKKLAYDKNKNFRQFKEDFTTAKTFLLEGDKDALHRLCANQVETFMEQWNNNDEFRQEYVSRCNTIASRRQKAPDGAPLVPDEVAPVLPSNVNGKVDRSPVSIPGEVEHLSVVLPVEQGKDVSSIESKNEDSHDTGKPIEKVSGQKIQELKNTGVTKPTNLGSGDVTKEAELAVVTELAENILTKEEIELARKAEELRKEEIAAKLKEQRRLEEKAKAVEALERKKRNAEKAQLRAELRARKEAEQKEKEREKRLRKKEKKTGGGDGCINGEEVARSEGSNEVTTKEIETVANKKKSQKPPAHFFSKQLKPKPVPPPLINKNKRQWQQLGRVALAVLAVVGVLFVFLLANFGLYSDYRSSRYTVAF